MSNEQNQAALSEFWQSTAPMSQVREDLTAPNGHYDLLIKKLEPQMDDNGLIFILGEFGILAPQEIAASPGASHRERYYIGTKKDPEARLPETRLNSPGFGRLKGIARVCDVPTNDQPVAALCSALINKKFSNRIEGRLKDPKDPTSQKYVNLGRNPVKYGTVPAKLDAPLVAGATAAPVTANGSAAPTSSVPEGVSFGD